MLLALVFTGALPQALPLRPAITLGPPSRSPLAADAALRRIPPAQLYVFTGALPQTLPLRPAITLGPPSRSPLAADAASIRHSLPLVEALAALGSGLDPESPIQIIGLILGWLVEFEAPIQVLASFYGRLRVIACHFVRDRTVRRIAESCRDRDEGCFRPKWYLDRTLRSQAESCRGETM